MIDNKYEIVGVGESGSAVIPLPEQKARALELLVQNVPVKEVATVLGVDRSSVYRWMTKEPFKSVLNKAREVVLDDLNALAKERLIEMMASDNLYAQQFAISAWTKVMAKNEVNLKVEQKEPKSLEELLAKINKSK